LSINQNVNAVNDCEKSSDAHGDDAASDEEKVDQAHRQSNPYDT